MAQAPAARTLLDDSFVRHRPTPAPESVSQSLHETPGDTSSPPIPSEPTTAAQIARRTSRGGLTYVGRTFAVQAIQVVSSLILARAVAPADYGTAALALT